MAADSSDPLLSVIILNYNGARWIEKCLESLRQQTIFPKTEIIVADNLSSDGSDHLAEMILSKWTNGRFLQNGANLGFCEGNNRGAQVARGNFLFFLNNDTWLEKECLERLINEVQNSGSLAGTPVMLNYDDDSPQSYGGSGFDIFGLLSFATPHQETREVFVCGGCSFFIQKNLFDRLGGFDPKLYMYADEYDLSWRVWISGAKAIIVPAARLHHRGAANVNPKGEAKVVEIRTTETKRFFTNRNNLLVLLKNCQHLLLLLLPLQILLLLAEAAVWFLIEKRWSFVKNAYFRAFYDCWRLRTHIGAERKRIAGLRRRSDWWLLRFFRLRMNRYDEIIRLKQLGFPKVTAS